MPGCLISGFPHHHPALSWHRATGSAPWSPPVGLSLPPPPGVLPGAIVRRWSVSARGWWFGSPWIRNGRCRWLEPSPRHVQSPPGVFPPVPADRRNRGLTAGTGSPDPLVRTHLLTPMAIPRSPSFLKAIWCLACAYSKSPDELGIPNAARTHGTLPIFFMSGALTHFKKPGSRGSSHPMIGKSPTGPCTAPADDPNWQPTALGHPLRPGNGDWEGSLTGTNGTFTLQAGNHSGRIYGEPVLNGKFQRRTG